MHFFLNSCDLGEIKEAASWGIVRGITMNPTMMAQAGGDFVTRLKAIREAVDVPIFAQVVSTEPDDILAEGRALAGLGDNIVVKVHANISGIKGMRLLKRAGLRICATAIHSVIEALVAAEVEADYAAIFVGLLAEVDEQDSNRLVSDVHQAYQQAGTSTKILVAARSINQLVHSAMLGVNAATCAFKLWPYFLHNAHTCERWRAFSHDWRGVFGERNWTKIEVNETRSGGRE